VRGKVRLRDRAKATLCGLFFLLLSLLAGPLHAGQSLYVLFADGRFAAVDTVTGVVSNIGTSIAVGQFPDLAANSHSQVFGCGGGKFFRIDPATAATSFIATNGLSAIAFSAQDVLYGVSNKTLVRVNPSTGALTPFGSTTHTFVSFAWRPPSFLYGVAYDSSGGNSDLYRINPVDGSQTFIGTFGGGCGRTFEIAFNSQGVLYGFENCSGYLRTIDPDTAAILTQSAFTIAGADRGNAAMTFPDSITLITNTPPAARCRSVSVFAGLDHTAYASVDDGSYDLDSGDTITLTQNPPGPYPLGNTLVTLIVTDNHGATNSCASTVTVSDSTPLVATQPATMRGQASALFNGMVVANGFETTAWLEWGADSGMNGVMPATNVGAGFSVVPVSWTKAGFLPQLTYHYRLVASNALGVARGAEQIFTTGRNVSAWGSNSDGQATAPPGLTNVVALAAGSYHSLALKADGRTVAWGKNNYGQTSVAAFLTNVVAVAAGSYHNLALKSDGRVVAWGNNASGQTNVPASLSNVVAVAAGESHSLTLRIDGRVVVWGDNSSGQTNLPPGLSNVVAVAAGQNHSLALRADGRVLAWGSSSYGVTNVPSGLTNVVAVTAGMEHSLVLTADGRVIVWGNNDFGQTTLPAGLSNVLTVAAGGLHSLALRKDGTLIPWGRSLEGQITLPTSLTNVFAVSGGGYHSLALGNIPPQAVSGVSSGLANHDLIIPLTASDANSDRLTFRVSTLPTVGALYQCLADGSRGAAISVAGTDVTDAQGRVIFVPATNAFGRPYARFGFVADDGQAISSEATIEVEITWPALAATQPAIVLGPGSATLNGMAVASGFPTTAWFEWGPDGGMSNLTTATNIGTGLGVVRVSLPAAGLVPRITYHCRLVTSNSFGVVRGAEQLFTTGKNVSAWGKSSSGPATLPIGLTNVVAVEAGSTHCMALKADGQVVAWGENYYSQLNIPTGLSNVVAVAGGGAHSLALKADGRVVGWGNNNSCQTCVPTTLTNAVAIAAGYNHSMALTADGRVVVWGDNQYGQLNVPAGLSNVVAVAGGLHHSLALRADGRVVVWGLNDYGQTNLPSGSSNVVAITAGVHHSLALRADGQVLAWGLNDSGQATVPAGLSNVLSVAGGWSHSLVLKSDGRIVAWGDNAFGQTNVPPGLTNAASVSAGNYHNLVLGNLPPQATPGKTRGLANQDVAITLAGSDPNNDPLTFKITTLPPFGALYQCLPSGSRGAAITASGTRVNDASNRVVFAPAANAFGRPYTSFGFVADDAEAISAEAAIEIEVMGPPLVATQPAAILGGATASLNGMVVGNGVETAAWFEWGTASGLSNATVVTNTGVGLGPVRVSMPVAGLTPRLTYHYRLVASNVFGVVRGAEQWFTTGKKVSAWGNNSYGQTNVPPGLSNSVAVAAGGNHSLALGADGFVMAWGYNNYGQTNVPLGLSNVVAVAAGGSHNLALKNDGRLVAWGYGGSGQTNVPADFSNAVAVAAGANHSLALSSDGRVLAWGNNDYAQTNVPADLSNVVAVAAGYTHNLALKADGLVVAWGNNASGQTNAPAGLKNAIAVAAGNNHSLALTSDGRVLAWGSNQYGQTNVPAGLSNVVAVAAGNSHSVALTSDGHVVAWGYNNSGQTNVPAGLVNAASVSAGDSHNLVLGNLPPQATPGRSSGVANQDLVIVLTGSDPNKDPLSFKITTLPSVGMLYQCMADGSRGAAIATPGAAVSDILGRVFFAPAANAFGRPYTSFGFVADDGEAVSTEAAIKVEIMGPPLVATQPPALVGAGNALLNGMVLGNGFETTAWFEWGTDTGLNNTTALANTGVGLGVVRVSLPVAGLVPRLTYHCRLVASNALGLVRGADQWFTAGKNVSAWGGNSYGQLNVPVGLSNLVAVAAGGSHTLALNSAGRVTAWGRNDYGQTNVPADLTNVVAVTAGNLHSLALTADRRAVAWGRNDYGQTNVPAGLVNAVAVAAGDGHSLALTAEGRVLAWGRNDYGQTNVPPGLSNVVAVGTGLYHSLALQADGRVVAWGYNNNGQTNVPPDLGDVVAVAGGWGHSLALRADGRMVGWGYNGYGQTTAPAGLSNLVSVAGGQQHNLVLKSDGRVVAWGYNFYGQTNVPAGLVEVVSVSAGGSHSVALGDRAPQATSAMVNGLVNQDLVIALTGSDANKDPLTLKITTLPAAGMLYQYLGSGSRGAAITTPGATVSDASGRVVFVPVANAFGQPYASFGFVADDGEAVSDEAMVEVAIMGPPLVATQPAAILGAGNAVLNGMVMGHGFATTAWFEWGTESGLFTTTVTSTGVGLGLTRVSLPINGLMPRVNYHCRLVASNVFGVVRGADQMFTTGKAVSAWGNNGLGQATVPAGLSNVVALGAGITHSLALRSDQTVLAWGNNGSGERTVPAGLSNVVAVDTSRYHNLALTWDGRVAAWGDNSSGQTTVPAGLSNVVAVAAGGNQSLALTSDGCVTAWGANNYGQTNPPSEASNIVALAAGLSHCLALRVDGQVVAWGNNGSGQASVPPALRNVVAVAAGDGHSLALTSDGRVVAWGDNSSGQTNIPAGLNTVLAVAAGATHNLALTSDDRVLAWGANNYGQSSVPAGLCNVTSVKAGGAHSLCLFDANQRPTVQLTLPASNTLFTEGDEVVLQAAGADSDGRIFRVEFYQGATLLGATTSSPFALIWTSPPPGQYMLTARAIDDLFAAATSAPVAIRINARPVVGFVTPSNTTVVTAGGSLSIQVAASDPNGSVARVDLYRQGTNLLRSFTNAPYTFNWTNPPVGLSCLTAVATDDLGATRSANVSVLVNQAPTVQLFRPTNGSVFVPPAFITITGEAVDPDDKVQRVELLDGTNRISQLNLVAPPADQAALDPTNLSLACAGSSPWPSRVPDVLPFSLLWSNAAAGVHFLTARVTDFYGATTASAAVNITVLAQPPTSYAPVTLSNFNRQTGLFPQTVRISNPTPASFDALRLWVRLDTNSAAHGVRVWNATGTSNGVPFVLYNQPLPPGQSVDLALEYYIPDRRTMPNPAFTVEVVPASAPVNPAGQVLEAKRVVRLGDGSVRVEFGTLENRIYYVQYSSDMTTWKTALPAITGTGRDVQWLDMGPPKTESAPQSVPMRVYRILLLP
jgi:alpha-tubulin suppressor-like RCC1 family protein